MRHPKADVDRLYLPRNSGVVEGFDWNCLRKFQRSCFISTLQLCQDWVLQNVMEYEKKNKKLLFFSVSKSHKYASEFRLNVENSSEVNTTATESTRNVKQETKKFGQKQIEENWSQTPLHSQFLLRSENTDIYLYH